jgi:hypothetical protein
VFFVPPDLNATISELSAMRLFRETPCAAAPRWLPRMPDTGIILWFFNGIYSIALPLSQDMMLSSTMKSDRAPRSRASRMSAKTRSKE